MILATAAVAALSSAASADFAYLVDQVGDDVVITGSGSIDLTGLTPDSLAFGPPDLTVIPDAPAIMTGAEDPNALLFIENTMNATAFGDGFLATASPDGVVGPTRSDYVGFAQRIPFFGGGVSVYVPAGFVSGDPLASSSIYTDTTIGELGFFDSGSYTTTLSNGTDLTVTIVPEPASAAVATLAATCLLRRLAELTTSSRFGCRGADKGSDPFAKPRRPRHPRRCSGADPPIRLHRRCPRRHQPPRAPCRFRTHHDVGPQAKCWLGSSSVTRRAMFPFLTRVVATPSAAAARAWW